MKFDRVNLSTSINRGEIVYLLCVKMIGCIYNNKDTIPEFPSSKMSYALSFGLFEP